MAAKLRHLEKLEIAIQGDDYADKAFEETNHEALTYAKAAAAVLGCPWSFEEQLRGGREYALERLKGLPNVGEFRAAQIYQLATSYFRTGECTCEALEALTQNRCPKDSDGHVRYQNNAQKQTVGAAAKLELSKLLGVSPLKAGQRILESLLQRGRPAVPRHFGRLRRPRLLDRGAARRGGARRARARGRLWLRLRPRAL